MDRPVIPLAAAFPPVTKGQWLALARNTLKGAAVGSLTSRTLDNIAVEPLYTAANARAALAFDPGPRPSRRPWDIRAIIAHADPAAANSHILEALKGGAASVLLQIGANGEAGLAIGSPDAMARALAGVLTEVAPVALDAGFLGVSSAQWLADAAKASPRALLEFHLDPLSSFARTGASPGPIDAHLADCAAAAARLAQLFPRASLFLASGRTIHEACGGEALELAFAAATALAYAKAMVRAGLPIEAAFAGVALGLALDADSFLSIAKLRAARIIWERITRACGARTPARLEARSSGRMLTRAEPWTNLIRLTIAGFAGAAGGADVIALDAFTAASGPPTAFAMRQARNTQLILMEEAGVGAVSDPGAGGWYVESLTADLARAAWERFRAIEAAGGVVAALEAGLIADEVARARETLAGRIASGALKIVAVTDYRNPDDAGAEVAADVPTSSHAPSPRLPGPDSACPPLRAIALEDLA